MRIQHNIAALNSYRQLGGNNNAVAKNLEKLSSGYKINRAGDDAAGLAISEKMRAQITGLETAQKNAQDGISLVQTAEGALTEVHSMLNRMVELATQSSNGTYDDAIDRENLQAEVDSLRDEINRISESTNFNGINLLDGSLGGPKTTKAPGDVLAESAMIGGQSVPATAATGNQYIVKGGPTGFTANKDSYVKITYTDENGESKKRTIKVSAAGDDAGAVKNLASAISADKELGKVFKAEVNADGDLVIEGRQTGSTAKSRITEMKGLADPTSTASEDEAGTSETYKFTAKDDETIIIEGKEFTFNKKGTGSDGKFKDVATLQTLLDAEFGAGVLTAGGTIDAAGSTTDFKVTKEDDSDASVTSGTASVTGNKDGEINEYSLTKFDLEEGVTRELEFEFTDQKGNTSQKITIKVTGGATKQETAQNIVDALQKNKKFAKAFANFDITANANGSIKFEGKTTGTIKSAVTALKVKTDGDGAASMVLGTEEEKDGLDTHLNLAGKTFKDGDTVTVGQYTFAYKKDSNGSDGKTFKDVDSLIAAASQHGVTIEDKSDAGDNSALVAKSAAKFTFDFDGRIGADVIGGSIDFAGTTFNFVEAGKPAKAGENMVNIAIAKDADAEQIAAALSAALKATTKADANDPESDDVNWKGSTAKNDAGKKTIVELTADQMGKIDMPKTKFAGFGINLQVGDTNDDFQKVRVSIDSMDGASLGIDKVDITNQNKAGESIKMIKDAINSVSSQRGKLGAVQNRLEHTINNLGVTTENITAAESRIRDTDMAKEMMAYTKNNILVQSAQAMLAQANTLPQGVLQLLG